MFIFVVPGMIAYAMHNDPLSGFKLPVEDGVVQSSGTCPQGVSSCHSEIIADFDSENATITINQKDTGDN